MLDTFELFAEPFIRLCKIKSVLPDMLSVELIDYFTSEDIGTANLLQASWGQHIPKGGEIALVMFSSTLGRRIIKIWSTEPDLDLIRTSEAISLGESFLSSKGGSYLYLENQGNLFLGSSIGTNKLSLLNDLAELKTTKFSLSNEDNFKVNIKDNTCIINKVNDEDKEIFNITIDGEGNLNIKTSGIYTINKVDDEDKELFNLTIDEEGNLNIKTSSNIELDGKLVQVKGDKFQVDGKATPTGTGPFCGIPNCVFSGAPHTGNVSEKN